MVQGNEQPITRHIITVLEIKECQKRPPLNKMRILHKSTDICLEDAI